jgi:hypothetical protein
MRYDPDARLVGDLCNGGWKSARKGNSLATYPTSCPVLEAAEGRAIAPPTVTCAAKIRFIVLRASRFSVCDADSAGATLPCEMSNSNDDAIFAIRSLKNQIEKFILSVFEVSS